MEAIFSGSFSFLQNQSLFPLKKATVFEFSSRRSRRDQNFSGRFGDF